MNRSLFRHSVQIYDVLLRLYPRNYRSEFGDEMKYVFAESLKDSYRQHGTQGLLTYWGRTLFDAVQSLIQQHREIRKGGDSMKAKQTDLINQNKVFLWIAAGTAALLTLPYTAMQFNLVKPDPSNPADNGADWSLFDFILMGALLFGSASLFVLIARNTPKKYRTWVGVAVLAAFLLLWVHLAVGIVDTWPLAGS